ncbi:MAG: tetratricopeptide repeat protein [Pseudolabrys sp.]
MADIFQEVDEEVRRERLKQLWDRYGIYLIILVVLIVGAVAGWRTYQWYEAKKAAEAGAAFEQAVALSEADKSKEAEAAFAKIAAEAPAGYRLLARLRVAAELANDDTKAAVAQYDGIAADTSLGQTMRDLAAVRAAILLVDTAPLDDMRGRLEPLAAADRAFRHTAREMLAMSAYRANDIAAARKYIDMVAGDAETPPGTRQRIEVLSALLASEGKGKG